jgi:hypothetical protein
MNAKEAAKIAKRVNAEKEEQAAAARKSAQAAHAAWLESWADKALGHISKAASKGWHKVPIHVEKGHLVDCCADMLREQGYNVSVRTWYDVDIDLYVPVLRGTATVSWVEG